MTQQHVASPPATTLVERDTSIYTGYTQATLRAWRREGRGPAYIRVGRSIRYLVADLDAWLTAHRVSTRDSPAYNRSSSVEQRHGTKVSTVREGRHQVTTETSAR